MPVLALVELLLYNRFSLANSLVEPIVVSDWLDIVGSLHPLGHIEFLGFLDISLMVSCVNEEELLEAIAAVQL